MQNPLGRRQVLRTSLGGAAAVGLGAGGLLVAAPGATAAPARPGRDEFPDVPGMLGDRRANELWYQFDEVTLYNSTPELEQAYADIATALGDKWERAIFDTWMSMAKSPDYPRNFTEYVSPIRGPLQILSATQLGVFDTFYRPYGRGLVGAFADFAQGVLNDPRRARPVHTMNGNPPPGYHIWFIFMRAMMLLGIDCHRWERIAPINAMAWAVQTIAKPDQWNVKEPLPRATVAREAAKWLPRGVARLDRDFQSYPYPEGMS
ncbi:hypothetical protein [Streptomyces dubilierae]|uniref:Tat pathway signal sequence domain protein n=1 Tax=Streptomyces dubilierae TaxID=3075533 RepID=A0ABU2P6G0_9ACTN|nr:hypothetical protein [Streptomyces sp. DSM 41921]MDT0387737.1 hypothetical protein [Streptomyces sp. DSM 41921]